MERPLTRLAIWVTSRFAGLFCYYIPDGFWNRWPRRPIRWRTTGAGVGTTVGGGVVGAAVVGAVVGAGVAGVAVGVCWVTLSVAAVATPFPLSVSVTGFFSPKFTQLRLV